MAVSAADQQIHARIAHGVAGTVWCVAPSLAGGSDANDGLTFDTPLLTLDPLAIGGTRQAGANDLILCPQGSINASPAAYLNFTAGVRLKGRGMGATTLNIGNVGVEIGGLTIEDLTIALTANGSLQFFRSGTAVLRRVRSTGPPANDGIFTDATCVLLCEDCDFASSFDSFNAGGGSIDADFIRCRFPAFAPAISANMARALSVLTGTTGRIRLFSPTLSAESLAAGRDGLAISNAGAVAIEVYGGTLYSAVAAGGGSALDVQNTGSGTVLLVGTDYDPAKLSGSGITAVTSPGGAPVSWSSTGNSFSSTDR